MLLTQEKIKSKVNATLHILHVLSNFHAVTETSNGEGLIKEKEEKEDKMKSISYIKEEDKVIKKKENALVKEKEKKINYTKSKEFFSNLSK